MIKIKAKFRSECCNTGKIIYPGEYFYWDKINRKAYHITSDKAENIFNDASLKSYIQAQEHAYWDNLTGGYYSK